MTAFNAVIAGVCLDYRVNLLLLDVQNHRVTVNILGLVHGH